MDSTASSLSPVPRFVESEADNDPAKNHEGAGEMKPSEPVNAPLGSKTSKGRLGSVTSKVWEHYIKLPCANRSEQTASCKYCNKELKCPSTSGTSALHNHLSRCSKYPLNSVDNKQTTLTFKAVAGDDSSSGSTLGTWKFDQMLCRKYCARMLVMDELPFRVVEHEGFRDFCSVMQPRFEVPSRFTIAKDCYDLFLTEKESFFNYLKRSKVRVCLTTDIWTSRQNLTYMCLTVHFIDREWKLHKRLLNFTLIPNHSGNVIGRCIEKHLLEWGIDKVLTITVDNATSNDVGIKYVKKRLNNWTKSVLSCNHLHLRCTAHIFNLVVKDGLKDLCDPIFRIRSTVRYVRSSPARLQRFKICVEQEKIESKSLVSLDCETRWNSTYLMLESAVKFERAFDRLEEQDDKYRSELISDKNKGLPLSTDWEYVRALLPFLKCFFDSTLSVSGSLYVTSNLFVSVVFGVGLQIKGQLTHASPVVREMAVRMKEKYDKYFGNVNNIN